MKKLSNDPKDWTIIRKYHEPKRDPNKPLTEKEKAAFLKLRDKLREIHIRLVKEGKISDLEKDNT